MQSLKLNADAAILVLAHSAGLAFQTARQRLEAEKSKWLAESRKRAKARDAARREQAEKEKQKERERASAEEAIVQ